MKGMCRERSSSWRNSERASSLLRHARIVTDPKKLAQLHAEAAKQKLRADAVRRGTI
jgi:hypothetical protein